MQTVQKMATKTRSSSAHIEVVLAASERLFGSTKTIDQAAEEITQSAAQKQPAVSDESPAADPLSDNNPIFTDKKLGNQPKPAGAVDPDRGNTDPK